MIDLTPLDVRKKAGDFKKVLRGYEPVDVDGFLELAAERLEEVVKENLTLRERVDRLQDQVKSHQGRESAVREALVMAQKLREDLVFQAEREADLARQEAEAGIQRRVAEGERHLDETRRALAELEKSRLRFLKTFRSLLQRELEAVEIEEAREPHEETSLELELISRAPRSPVPFPTEEELDGLWMAPDLAAASGVKSGPTERGDVDDDEDEGGDGVEPFRLWQAAAEHPDDSRP